MNKLVSGQDLEAAVRAMAAETAVLRGQARPDLVRDEVLAELFATTAAARGYRIVYVCEGRVWTYAQVHAASDSIARGLVRAGIGPGDVVGLWMPRGIELLIAQIAITQVRRRLAALRCRRAGRAHRDLPRRRAGQGARHRRSSSPSAAAAGRRCWTRVDLDDAG